MQAGKRRIQGGFTVVELMVAAGYLTEDDLRDFATRQPSGATG